MLDFKKKKIAHARSQLDFMNAPEGYSDLIVRVTGYSDYFVDLDEYHQQEIIDRTTQKEF